MGELTPIKQRVRTIAVGAADKSQRLVPANLGAGGGAPDGVFTMTAGNNGAVSNGYRRNAALAPPNDSYGTITDGADPPQITGNIVAELWTEGPTGLERWQIGLDGTGLPDTDASWIDVSITGVFNTGAKTVVITRGSVEAAFAGNSGDNTIWRGGASSVTDFLVGGNSYDVVFT